MVVVDVEGIRTVLISLYYCEVNVAMQSSGRERVLDVVRIIVIVNLVRIVTTLR